MTFGGGPITRDQGDNDRSVASKTSHHILQLLQTHPAMKGIIAREVSSLVLKPQSTTIPGASGDGGGGGGHIRFNSEKETGKKAAPTKSDAASHARYYGLITLNQITLTVRDQEVAEKLVDLYFEVFREILGDGTGEEDDEIAGKRGQGGVEKITGKVEKWRGRRKGAKPKGERKSALDSVELVDSSEAKLVAAVLTGINRALPFAKLDETM